MAHERNSAVWNACGRALDEVINRITNHPKSEHSTRRALIGTIYEELITAHASWGSSIEHGEFCDTPQSAFDKIATGWDGLNGHPAKDTIVIGFGGSSYLRLNPNGTYSYYETAT
jgi:predicted small metal-binding protein